MKGNNEIKSNKCSKKFEDIERPKIYNLCNSCYSAEQLASNKIHYQFNPNHIVEGVKTADNGLNYNNGKFNC